MTGEAAHPPSLVFTRDIPCIHCGYNLRSIPASALCPECGKPAADALDSLHAAEPRAISRIRLGLLLLTLAGTAVPIIAFGIAILAGVLGNYTNLGGFGSVIETCMLVAGFAIGVLGPTAAAVGTFFLAAPVRRSIDHSIRRPIASPLARAIMLLAAAFYSLCGSTVWLVVLGLTTSTIKPPRTGEEYLIAFLIGTALLGLAGWSLRNTLASPLLATLCRRSGARRFAHIFSIMTWLSAAMFIMILLAGTVALIGYLFSTEIEAYFDRGNAILGFLYIAASVAQMVVSIAFIGWMFLWPVTLIATLRHLGKIGAQATLNATGLLGAAPIDDGLPTPTAPPTAPVPINPQH